jgi:hypothetical protein
MVVRLFKESKQTKETKHNRPFLVIQKQDRQKEQSRQRACGNKQTDKRAESKQEVGGK